MQQFLPHMIEERSGAILTALHGERHEILGAVRGEVRRRGGRRPPQGVYVGMLYIGAIIENSAFHTQAEEAKAAGAGRDLGTDRDPAHLADLLWNMHSTKSPAEATYSERRVDR